MTTEYQIYIFGVNGYIGRHLARYALSRGIRVLGLDIDEVCALEIDYLPCDVSEREAFNRLDFEVDQVFFLAGLTGTEVGFSAYEAYIRINQIGLNHLLDRMVQCQSRARVVFPSTRLVYRGQTATPLTEEADKAPLTPYALNKLASEHLLDIYANRFGIAHTIFRIAVPYGNRLDADYSYGTMGFFLSMARQGKKLTVFGDGSLMRTFTHVDDICRVMVRASCLPATRNQVLNIGGETFSLLEVAKMIAEKFGGGIEHIPFPEVAARLESGDTIFDDARLRAVLPDPYRQRFKGWLEGMG